MTITHDRNGIAYPVFPWDTNGSDAPPLNDILFHDGWGFTYRWSMIVNRGDTDKYPATAVIERRPPTRLPNLGVRYYAVPFNMLYDVDALKLLICLPSADVEPERLLGGSRTNMLPGMRGSVHDSIWQHRNGPFYRIKKVANVENTVTLPRTVIYQNVETQEAYAGRSDDWDRRMTLVVDGYDTNDATSLAAYVFPAKVYKYEENSDGVSIGREVCSFPPKLVVYSPNEGRAITKPVDMEHSLVLHQIARQHAERSAKLT